MKFATILLGLLSFVVFCATNTEAIKCGQTDCNENKGGYCCAEKSSSMTKDCCCTGVRPTNYTINCYHSSGLPTWAIVVIVIVIIGIIGGVVGAIFFIRRRRLNNVPYGQTS